MGALFQWPGLDDSPHEQQIHRLSGTRHAVRGCKPALGERLGPTWGLSPGIDSGRGRGLHGLGSAVGERELFMLVLFLHTRRCNAAAY